MAGRTRSVIRAPLGSIPEAGVLDVGVVALSTAVAVASEDARLYGLASHLHERGHDRGPV